MLSGSSSSPGIIPSARQRISTAGWRGRKDARTLAKKALLQLFEPLVEFVLDSGLSTLELHSIFREAAVRTVAARQLELSPRVNISGIAASTGIPRAEISRILKLNAESSRESRSPVATVHKSDIGGVASRSEIRESRGQASRSENVWARCNL